MSLAKGRGPKYAEGQEIYLYDNSACSLLDLNFLSLEARLIEHEPYLKRGIT
jgi:hypothetical protein